MIKKFFGWKINGYRLEKENHDNLTTVGKGSQFLFLFNSQLQSLDSRLFEFYKHKTFTLYR